MSVHWSPQLELESVSVACGYDAGDPEPPSVARERRSLSESACTSSSYAVRHPEPIAWDETKRCLMLISPTGVSPARKKMMCWSQSQADDPKFLADILPEMHGLVGGGGTDGDAASEASDVTNDADHFDLGVTSPRDSRRKIAPELFCKVSSGDAFDLCEPAIERGSSNSSFKVPMWTVEEDLLILQLVRQYTSLTPSPPRQRPAHLADAQPSSLTPSLPHQRPAHLANALQVEHHGKRWSKIAAHLQGRTDNGVRNRWNRMEKAQTLRHRNGAEHGYRCRRCGQPKRGHICAALTSGEQPEGDTLALKAAELTALSAFKMRAMLAEKNQASARAPPVRSVRSMPNPRLEPPVHAGLHSLESLKPTTLEPLSKWTTHQKNPSKLKKGDLKVEPLMLMDEAQLDDFLTELHLSLATPTPADRMQHAIAMTSAANGVPMVHMAAAGGQMIAAGGQMSAAGGHMSTPAHHLGSCCASASTALASAPPSLILASLSGSYALPNLHGVEIGRHSLSGGPAYSEEPDDLVAAMLYSEPAILPQQSTDTVLASAMPTISLNRSSSSGNGLGQPEIWIPC